MYEFIVFFFKYRKYFEETFDRENYQNFKKIIYNLINPRKLSLKKLNFKRDKLSIIYKSSYNIVFADSKYVYKFIYNLPHFNRENELFYSFYFDKQQNHNLYLKSLSYNTSTLICMKKCRYTLKDIKEHHFYNFISNLVFDLISQILLFHSKYVIHNDIKPSNIVFHNKKWIIIDYGLMSKYHPLLVPSFNFKCGTPDYNIPRYSTSKLQSLATSERLFWMYMKDWFSFGKIIEQFKKEYIGRNLQESIESLNKQHVIYYMNILIKKYYDNKSLEKNKPFYIRDIDKIL